MRLPHAIATAFLVLAMLAAPARAATPLVPVDPHFQDEPVLENLDSPVAVRFAPPPDGRIFVAEKSGIVEAFDGPGDTTPALVVDLRDEVHDFWDRGLLGMALDPGFATNGRLYLLYTRDKPIGGDGPPHWGDTCPDPPGATDDGCVVSGALVRVTVDALGLGGDVNPLLQEQWCQQFPSHSVATVAFGPDGMLYAGAGDGAGFTQPDYGQLGGNPCGDPEREGGSLRSQDIRTLGDPTGLDGAIVRLDPATGARRIVGYGLRNPFRFAFRPGTSELWIGDVGDARWEEIDRIADPGGGGEAPNFGWPCFEGVPRNPRFKALLLPLCTSLHADEVTPPVYQYPHQRAFVSGGDCVWPAGASVSGIAFHGTDGGYPARYDGALFFADYSLGCIFSMPAGDDGEPDPGTVELFARPAAAGAQEGGPVELQTGPGGDLYYPLYDPEDPGSGSVRRIRYVPGNLAPRAAIAADRTQGDVPLTVSFSAAGSSDPDGDALSYAWDLDGDGAFDDGTGPEAMHTYTAIGTVRAGVRVSDPDGASGTAFAAISVGNTAPVPVIEAPSASQRWAVGEPVAFHGSASDAEDGPLPASALRWVLALEHCIGASGDCHTHPLEQRDGVDGGSVSGPEHDYPSRLVLKLVATDSRGLTGEATVRLEPRPAVVTATTDPPGGTVDVDGIRGTSVQRTVIAGSRVTVATDPAQEIGGLPRAFAGWSDGELAASRAIRPAGDVALVARFTAAAGPGAAPGGGGTPGRDRVAPRVRVLWPRSHRIDRRSLAVRVRCSEACTLSPRAWLVASGRRIRLAARVDGHTRVVIHLTAAARSRARRALRHGRSARIRLEVVARDTAGNRARLRRALRLG